jgi:hypothetical protein
MGAVDGAAPALDGPVGGSGRASEGLPTLDGRATMPRGCPGALRPCKTSLGPALTFRPWAWCPQLSKVTR